MKRSACLRTILTMVLIGVSAVAASADAPICQNVNTWKSWHTTTTFSDCRFQGIQADPETSARAFVDRFGAQLGLSRGSSDLQLIEVKHGLASSHSRFQQTYQGLPVFGGLVSVHQDKSGSVESLHRRTFERPVVLGEAVLSALDAEAVARAAAGKPLAVIADSRLPHRSKRVWFPLGRHTDGFALVPAWELMIYSRVPLGDFLIVVDARNGNVLFNENRIAFDTGTGYVYIPNPMQSSGNTGLADGNDATNPTLDGQRISVTLEGLDAGTGLLVGEYVDLTLSGGLSVPDADEPTRQYFYDRDDPRFEQVNIYHSIDQIQRYFHTLGFDDDTGTANGIRDFPSMANAHWDNADQSFYSTGDDGVHFGDGGVDDGEDADIIAHEYGHAIQHNQNASWGGGQMGAMGEGFGDYLAMSFYYVDGDGTYQAANNACVGEWDAVSYSGTNPPCLRRTDGNKMYPDDLVGQVHADGEIWSRALWDIRNELGGMTTDQLVLEHHFALPGGATMPVAALAMITADENVNDGDNESALREHFCNRGILSAGDCLPLVAAPTLTYPAGGENVSGGSNVNVTWNTNGAPADTTYNVEYTAQCTPSVNFTDDMESGSGNWVISHDQGSVDWSLSGTNPNSGSMAFFATDPGALSDQFLTLASSVNLPGGAVLSFWHDYNTESTYDGGVVEISTDNTTWNDLGSAITQNGYNGTISTQYNSPISGQEAFTGSSGGYVETLVDLSAYSGQSVWIRFRMASDTSVAGTGWSIDDVSIQVTGAWNAIGTSAAGATALSWSVPAMDGADYCVRLLGQASGHTDSVLVTGSPFTVSTTDIFADGFESGDVTVWSSSVGLPE